MSKNDDLIAEEMTTNPFGTWVRQQREAKGWSQLRLARESGVSQPQISTIEAGRSLNPQQSTRTKIEKALGESVPVVVTAEAAKDQEISGVGALTDFDPYDDESLPECSGVYVFYDVTERPVYVGKSKRLIRIRVREHYEKFWFKRPVVDHASYIKIEDPTLCDQVEQVLIKFLKSNALLNKQHVERED